MALHGWKRRIRQPVASATRWLLAGGLAQQLWGVSQGGVGIWSPDIDWGDNLQGGGRRRFSACLPPRSIVAWAQYAKAEGEKYGWPYAHVLANAGITSDYGWGTAYLLSWGKEFLDLCKGLFGNDDSLYSAFQPLGFEMNQIGRSIPKGASPEGWAAPYRNYPEGEPGPFYGK